MSRVRTPREMSADAAQWLWLNRRSASVEWMQRRTAPELTNVYNAARDFDRAAQIEEALVRLVAVEQNAANLAKWEQLLQAVRK